MIEVWVCARPGASQLAAVLSALTAVGAEPRLAMAPEGQGPAAARNEALANCESEVLALVDDDVEVTAGWLDALQAAWSGPGARAARSAPASAASSRAGWAIRCCPPWASTPSHPPARAGPSSSPPPPAPSTAAT
jgi:hypothetical protein